MPEVFGIEFSKKSEDELVRAISTDPIAHGAGPRTIVTANLDHVVLLERDRSFRACYDSAWAATADGMPVYLYARLRGAGVPDRVTGADVFSKLMGTLKPQLHRCFFIANSEEAGRRLVAHLRDRGFSSDALACVVPPFGFERDQAYSDWLARQVRLHRATHLFLGVGAPKSEIWAHKNRNGLGDCYVLAVGAGLDYFAAVRRRAPVWMQKSGFEWLWRLACEPRRLYRRYLVNSWAFLAAIQTDLQGAIAHSYRARLTIAHAQHGADLPSKA